MVTVRLTPKASGDRIGGVRLDAAGAAQLKVWVTAPPVDGRANAALVELLARTWRLPKRAFTIRRGAADRTKELHVAGDPAELARRIMEALT
jgi:uncharacterized protein YggU (UPF0235/DUF167 family)